MNISFIKHLFKIIWHRKKSNFLLTFEMLIAFIALFAVSIIICYHADNYFKPLGFNYERVWELSFNPMDAKKQEIAENLIKIEQIMQQCPEIDSYALGETYVFDPFVTSEAHYQINGQQFTLKNMSGSNNLFKVFNFNLTKGNWFNDSTKNSAITPIVINKQLADKIVLTGENIIGKTITKDDKTKLKIIGVIEGFRSGGDIAGQNDLVFFNLPTVSDTSNIPTVDAFGIKYFINVKTGIDKSFEEKLMKSLNNSAKSWNLSIQTLTDKRKSALKQLMIIPTVLSAISIFLLLNVVLGLFGVIWYSINKRKREIGIRRALGADQKLVYMQIVGEVLVITTIGIIPGILLVIQFPLLNLLDFISTGVYLAAFAMSISLLYMITIVCAIYPGYLATQIDPAEALHGE